MGALRRVLALPRGLALRRLLPLAAAWAALAAPRAGLAQDLGARVLSADGSVAFRFAARPDVEVCEGGVRMNDGHVTMGRWREGWDQQCVRGGAEVRLVVAGRRVRSVEVGPPRTARADRDLGVVPAAQAARWLLALEGRAEPKAARDALLPAVLADSVETWPRLLEIGRDLGADPELRKGALFWASQAAAEVVTQGLADVARDRSDDESVRQSAVFALSRRPPDEAVPILMEVARTGAGRSVRQAALFWLARLDDPRVIPFFEHILRAAPRR